MSSGAEDFAVVVAAMRYDYAPPYHELRGTLNDAEDFIKWLKSDAGGNVPDDHIKFVKPDAAEPVSAPAPVAPLTVSRNRPNVSDVKRDGFDPFYILATKERKRLGRRLYIFMAGHGFAQDPLHAAFIGTEAVKGGTDGYVHATEYALWFQGAKPLFDEIVVFMDSCRTKLDLILPKMPPYKPLPLGDATVPDTRLFYGFAAGYLEEAPERAFPVPGSEKKRWQGLFTTAVIEGLNGVAPRDAQRRITGTTLADYVHSRLADLSIEYKVDPPAIARFPLNGDNIVFANPPAVAPAASGVSGTAHPPGIVATGHVNTPSVLLTPAPTGGIIFPAPAPAPKETSTSVAGTVVEFTFSPARFGRVIVLEDGLASASGAFPVLDECTAGPTPWIKTLPSGLYGLRDGSTGQTMEFQVLGRRRSVTF